MPVTHTTQTMYEFVNVSDSISCMYIHTYTVIRVSIGSVFQTIPSERNARVFAYIADDDR